MESIKRSTNEYIVQNTAKLMEETATDIAAPEEVHEEESEQEGSEEKKSEEDNSVAVILGKIINTCKTTGFGYVITPSNL